MSHYTGIDVAQAGPLYMQRDSYTHKIGFARLSRKGWMLGIKRGYLIHGALEIGFEVFTSDIHVAYSRRSAWGVTWHGSGIDPLRTYTLCFGRIRIGSTTDKWLKRMVYRKRDREFMREMEAYEFESRMREEEESLKRHLEDHP